MRRAMMMWAFCAAGVALPLRAQGFAPKRDDQKRDTSAVPAHLRPPEGMCRIWLDGVPSSHQPAPTDCPTAIRNRPPNARVIFGDLSKTAPKGDRTPDRTTETRLPRIDTVRKPPELPPRRPPDGAIAPEDPRGLPQPRFTPPPNPVAPPVQPLPRVEPPKQDAPPVKVPPRVDPTPVPTKKPDEAGPVMRRPPFFRVSP